MRIRWPGRSAWLAVADLVTVALMAVLLWVICIGSIDSEILGVRIVVRSIPRLVRNLLLLTVLRHAIVPRPTLVTVVRSTCSRLQDAFGNRWPTLAEALPVAIGTRAAVLFAGYLAVVSFGYARGEPPFRVADSELFNLPARWDAGWYLNIATRGYNWRPDPRRQANIVFFPAYPMTVRAAGLFQLGRGDAAAAAWLAVVVSTAAFAAALAYLYRLSIAIGATADQARGALLLIAAYPFALFFGVPYSESLFLLASVGACYHQSRAEPVRAALWGLVAGLTRPNGAMLCAALAIIAASRWHARRHTGTGVDRALALSALAPLAGTALYTAVVWWYTGQPLLWLTMQSTGWGRSAGSIDRVVDDVQLIGRYGLLMFVGQHPARSLQLLGAVLGLVAVWPVTRRVGTAYGAWVALNVLVPLGYGGLLSIGRFTAVLFPIFIWLALALDARTRAAAVCAFAVLQGLCAALFFTWRPLF